ncbi:MAG: hypothetical protein ACXACE_09605 [Candidatus Thorarchaeota archaeon]|jgi:hypothetical protein
MSDSENMAITHSGGREVLVRTNSGDCVEGIIEYRNESLEIVLKNGVIIPASAKNVVYSIHSERVVDNTGKSVDLQLKMRANIVLKPLLVIKRFYSAKPSQFTEDIYPPSTYGWYTRFSGGTRVSLYIVQRMEDANQLWLTILDSETGLVYESHMVEPYETEILSLFEKTEAVEKDYAFLDSRDRDLVRNEVIGSLLDSPPPTWEQMTKLTADIIIPNMKLGENMREAMNQLVPDVFSKDIREELMSFLVWVARGKVPDENPVQFFGNLYHLPILRVLLMGHTLCIKDGVNPPPYVKLMMLASRGQLEAPKRPPVDVQQRIAWSMFWHKVSELFPDWRGLVVESVSELNSSMKFISRLPVTKSAAKRTKLAWRKRFAMLYYGLFIHGLVNPRSLGLRRLLYVGAAHRWASRHLSWTARLGEINERPPHLQVMEMPPSAAERVKRLRPNVITVEWSAYAVNPHLYNAKENVWQLQTKKILDAAMGNETLRKLKAEFGYWRGKKPYIPSATEAKVLDLLAGRIFLADLEHSRYPDLIGMGLSKLRTSIDRLSKIGVVNVLFQMIDVSEVSVLTIAQGDANQVYSLTGNLLRNSLTSLAMVGEGGGFATVLSRVPTESAQSLLSTLPMKAEESDLVVRCMTPRAYQNYRHTLYQRLLKEDGTWDDDVGPLVSQVRSRKPEL